MHTITVQTGTCTSRVLIGESLGNLSRFLPQGARVVVITDASVLSHYQNALSGFPVIVIGEGESHKTMQTLEHIFQKLIGFEADRSTFIVGVGGGLVSDVTGFAASTFMRGLRFGFVSTTLLSQVDASVGGKNGVNLGGYKNMVGTFAQPEFVICDPEMLRTLPQQQLVSGFAEIVKAGAIRDADLFEYLEQNAAQALQRSQSVLEHIILRSVQMKAGVVERDEHEQGERRILNFGHTFGHAIEKLTQRPHGEAVSIGMVIAARISHRLGMISAQDVDRLTGLLQSLTLPVDTDLSVEDLFTALKKDKKKVGDSLHLVLLRSLGNAEVRNVPLAQIETWMHP